MTMDEKLAKIAWEAWLESAKSDTCLSDRLLGWDYFPESVKVAWLASAKAVLAASAAMSLGERNQ